MRLSDDSHKISFLQVQLSKFIGYQSSKQPNNKYCFAEENFYLHFILPETFNTYNQSINQSFITILTNKYSPFTCSIIVSTWCLIFLFYLAVKDLHSFTFCAYNAINESLINFSVDQLMKTKRISCGPVLPILLVASLRGLSILFATLLSRTQS